MDPGHGGIDPGATFGRIKEKDIVLSVAAKLYDELDINCYDTMLSRVSDYKVLLLNRALAANDWGADIFVSIHCNADPDEDAPGMREAKGSEIWIYPGSKEGMRLALCISNRVPEFFPGRRFRGIKEARFTVLKRTRMPSVLVELAFIDTRKSHELGDFLVQQKIARCIASGIEDYAMASKHLA